MTIILSILGLICLTFLGMKFFERYIDYHMRENLSGVIAVLLLALIVSSLILLGARIESSKDLSNIKSLKKVLEDHNCNDNILYIYSANSSIINARSWNEGIFGDFLVEDLAKEPLIECKK